MSYMSKKGKLLMFSSPLAFILLAVPKFMFLKLHISNHCFKLSESFAAF